MTEKTKWLSEYGINLTEKYRNSKELAIAIGREKEIREITEVLTKKTKANVALTGKPGTGKTRIVEGLASKIATGNTVDALKDVDIWELDLALLTNTDESDGGFSYRFKKIIDEAKESNIILFIDEMHTIIASGAKKGGLDGSNILKPALARGEIKMIGATTSEEYRIIERDPAFQRRFQQIYISEPSREDSINILKFRKRSFEIFFGINIDDSAIEAAVDLSIRYLPSRSLPDKAIDTLDQSSASLKLDLDSLPSSVESKFNQILNLKAELKMTNSVGQRKLEDKIKKLEKELEDDKVKISIQKEALELLKNFRQALKEKEDEFRKLKESKGSEEKLAELTSEIKKAFDTLENYKEIYEQGEPLINDTLYASNIQQTIENLTGIPVSDMNKSERDKIKNLESDIAKRMIGQKEAVKAVSYAIKRNRLGLGSPDQPIFVGMFLGVSGTGKTELVKTLADKYFGNEKAMKRFDMGEFKTINSISRLIGANPGEGDADDRGGELTEWAKHNPYSIILFDEAEKAHSQVWDLMLSLFDDGVLTDSRGDVVDFKNTIIIMTSNLGSQLIARGFDNETGELDQATKDNVQALLRNPDADKGGKGFKPEFINRIDSIVIFGPLSDSELEDIATLKLKSLKKRLIKSRNIKLVFGKKIVPTLKTKATLDVSNWLVQQLSWDDKKLGARPINRYITTEIEDKIVDMLLQEEIEDGENILIKPKHPTPLTYIGDDGQERPTPPILDFSTVSDKEYKSLIKEDPVENWIPSD